MGTNTVSDVRINLASAKSLLRSESTDEGLCSKLDLKSGQLLEKNECTDLQKSSSEGKLIDCNGILHRKELTGTHSPPDFLRLSLSSDGLTQPTIGCLSPLTPTSKFHKSMLSNESSSLVIATVLCNWDNICGPKVRCLWMTKHKRRADLTLDLLNFIANQTLSGEIMHDLETPALELKLYISADKGIILATLVFGAESKKDVAVHSLSMIVPYEDLQEFLKWKDVCLEWMQRTVQRLRIELTKNVDGAFESFRNSFAAFIKTNESAIWSGFPKKIEMLDTILHPHHVFDGEFVRRAVVAHLLQCQQTVVLGNSTQHVNLMINTLSMFMTAHRKHRCRLLADDANDLYSPEFCLQGVWKSDESTDDLLKNIYFSHYPTALVDLSEEKVWILCLPNEYSGRRRKFVLQDLNALFTDVPVEKELTLESVFQSVSFEDTLVNEFLKEFHSLPFTHGVREIFIRNFMSSLQRRSLSLIELTERELQKNSSINVLTFMPKLRQMLSLKFFSDLTIVLCVAELLKPGIMGLICSNERSLDQLMP